MPSYFKPKDQKARRIAAAFEIKRAGLQFFLRSNRFSNLQKQHLVVSQKTELTKALKYTVKSRNRCNITFRAGSVFRYFRLSRIMIKQLASRGSLPGIRKSSW